MQPKQPTKVPYPSPQFRDLSGTSQRPYPPYYQPQQPTPQPYHQPTNYPQSQYSSQPTIDQNYVVYTEPYEAEPTGRVSKHAIIAMFIFMIMIVLIGISMFSAWYNMKMNLEGSIDGEDVKADMDMEMHLDDADINLNIKASEGGDYDFSGKGKYKENVKSTMDITAYLALISIIILILGIIFIGIYSLGKISNRIGLLLGILGLIFILITFIYFPIGITGAMKKEYEEGGGMEELKQYNLEYDGSFIGGKEVTLPASKMPGAPADTTGELDIKWSWGPHYGWYLFIVAFILSIIGLILVKAAAREEYDLEKLRAQLTSKTEQKPVYGDSRDMYAKKEADDDYFNY